MMSFRVKTGNKRNLSFVKMSLDPELFVQLCDFSVPPLSPSQLLRLENVKFYIYYLISLSFRRRYDGLTCKYSAVGTCTSES